MRWRRPIQFLGFFSLIAIVVGVFAGGVVDFRQLHFDFRSLSESQVMIPASMTRRQEASLKVGFLVEYMPPEVGLFGNHQVQYFSGRAFSSMGRPVDFFNFWYADLSIIELRDYIGWIAARGKLPKSLVLVAMTTPNNDNGRHIANYNGNLPADIHDFVGKLRTDLQFLQAVRVAKDIVWWMEDAFSYQAVAAAVARNTGGPMIFDPARCASPPPSDGVSRLARFLPRTVGRHLSGQSYVLEYCGRTFTGLRRDGATALEYQPPEKLIQNENALNPAHLQLAASDAAKIAEAMQDIDAFVRQAGAHAVFLIPPVYETERASLADDIVNDALGRTRNLDIIDHRKSYREAKYFVGYDHPGPAYFEQVVAELVERRRLR